MLNNKASHRAFVFSISWMNPVPCPVPLEPPLVLGLASFYLRTLSEMWCVLLPYSNRMRINQGR